MKPYHEAATGETFCKLDKTDILIEFENKAAFIGECKIWHGEKCFKMRFGRHLTTPHGVIRKCLSLSLTKQIVLFNLFCRKFGIGLIKTQYHTQPDTNVWNCKYHRKDMNEDVRLAILAFDLYVDKNQFRDARYEK